LFLFLLQQFRCMTTRSRSFGAFVAAEKSSTTLISEFAVSDLKSGSSRG
jgi:hypothetical protein